MKGGADRKPGRILLLLRVPPPFGGGELRAQWLADRVKDWPDFYVHVWRTSTGSRARQGRLAPLTIWHAVRRLLSSWAALMRHKPAVVFLSLPKSFVTFLWAAAVIVPASLAGVRVCTDLAGMRFEFDGWRRKAAQRVLRRVYSIRFLAHSICRAHAAWGFRNPVVIYNGIEAPAPIPRSEAFARKKPLRMLYLGLLDESKGVGVLVETAILARRAGMSAAWVLAGEWSSRAFERRMRAQLRAGGAEDAVQFPGLVTGSAKWELLHSAHILVHPTRLDGQPLTILEAMSQGLAVVSTRVGGIPETVLDGRNGRLLDSATPAAVLAVLQELDSDRERLHQIMRTNVLDFQRRFNVARYVERLTEWLSACADGRVTAFTSDAAPAEAFVEGEAST